MNVVMKKIDPETRIIVAPDAISNIYDNHKPINVNEAPRSTASIIIFFN